MAPSANYSDALRNPAKLLNIMSEYDIPKILTITTCAFKAIDTFF